MAEQSLIEPIEINARVVLNGRTALVMHHTRTADPDNDMQAAINEIVAKGRKMTPEDRKRKEALQWRATLYTDKEDGNGVPQGRLIVPMKWLISAWEGGGKTLGTGTSSKGAAVVRSVVPGETQMHLTYDGPQDINELSKDPRFQWRTMVNPNPSASQKKLLPSMRAIVPPPWSVTTDLSVVTDMGLSWEDFQRASHAAGNIGIGDARKLGYGRFRVKITKLK